MIILYIYIEVTGYLGIEMEAIDAMPMVEIVSGEVLAAGGHLEAVAVVNLLQTPDIAGRVLGSHKWVLPRRLLPPTPPWVPEYVHVWAPIR